jgi:hypothetical protein
MEADKQVLARFVTKLPPELRVPAAEVVRPLSLLILRRLFPPALAPHTHALRRDT